MAITLIWGYVFVFYLFMFILFSSVIDVVLCCMLLLSDDWSSISSTTSSLGGGDTSAVFTPKKPCTSNPTLHAHHLGDLDPQGHHRRGSSGDKIKIQISPEFKSELADMSATTITQGLFYQ